MSTPKIDASEHSSQLSMLASLFEAIRVLSEDPGIVQDLARLGWTVSGEWFVRIDDADGKLETVK